MRKFLGIWAVASMISIAGCADEWLTTTPQTILTDEQVWGDPSLILAVLSNYYSQIPQHEGLENSQWTRWQELDEGIVTQQTSSGAAASANFGYGYRGEWSWDLMRNIHVAMDGIEATQSGDMTPELKTQFLAELRFIRALVYFEKVKRMGGVPLITEQLIYDFSGDPSYLHTPRAREEEVYDFIASEMDAIMNDLAHNEGSKTRATPSAALALKSRAMLYAASIARHNAEMASPITLPGGEVGIPASRAAEYYQKSLDASRALINSGKHQLVTGPDPAQAFHDIFVTKGHTEVILAKDYSAGQGLNHWFSMRARPQTMKVDQYMNWANSEISAFQNVMQGFSYMDGTPAGLEVRGASDGTVGGQSNWIFYDEIDDIFDDIDQRFYATLLGPGGEFEGQQVQLQAGVYEWDAGLGRYVAFHGPSGSTFDDGGVLTGFDGPVANATYLSATGFFIKKYLDPSPGAGRYTPGAETWWVLFRLGEIYMNAAEAAFELGLEDEALGYVNTLRERAGWPANSLNSLTREIIRNERYAELAFEDHRYWDLRRWRTAHEVWDGDPNNPTARLWVLFPYRVVHPGSPNDGKFVYDHYPSTLNTAPRFFRFGNYYTEISQGQINNNPALVRNPFH